jgi:hypothetical protein
MTSGDVSPVQTVGAGVFMVRIHRSEATRGDIEYLFELTIETNRPVTLKLDDVKHLTQLLRLIATEVQHDGHASRADREWIQKLVGNQPVESSAIR